MAKIKELLARYGITDATIKKALRTFLQAFIGTFIADLTLIFTEQGFDYKFVLYSVLIPAISMALATIMNIEKTNENESEGDI